MKFANVDGVRIEAAKDLRGECPVCGSEVFARCGPERVDHWAHKSTQNCVGRKESEGPWHRGWKNSFPEPWQEQVHIADDGERHFADVKTPHGLVIEFQHSPISVEERESREMAHQTMIWVVDGLRGTRALKGFRRAMKGQSARGQDPFVFDVFPGDSAIVRRWISSRKVVFFDFGSNNVFNETVTLPYTMLWRLDPCSDDYFGVLSPIAKTELIDAIVKGEQVHLSFREERKSAQETTKPPKETPAPKATPKKASVPSGLPGFERFLQRRRRNWRL